MTDPSQVIDQIGRYRSEGRLEISEVMAQELTMLLQHDKERDLARDGLLVQALREYAGILAEREKWTIAWSAAKQLRKSRTRYSKRAAKEGQDDMRSSADSYAAADEVLAGRIAIGLGKAGKAASRFGAAIKMDNSDVEPFLLRLEAYETCKGSLRGRDGFAKHLSERLQSAGPVNRLDGIMVLQPREHGPRLDATRLAAALRRFGADGSGLSDSVRSIMTEAAEEIERQIASIEAGEQAANARLAAAVEKLKPTIDYHSYSQSN